MRDDAMSEELQAMRRSYELGGLAEGDLAADWLTQLRSWVADAHAANLTEPNAMTFATVDADGRPSARTVLLKGLDERGLVLFTNLDSRKGREARANPAVALVLAWVPLQRQVTVLGDAAVVDDAEADAYFAARPRGSQLGAAASPQSEVVPDRATLDAAQAALAERHPEGTPVPRPYRWGGFRVTPRSVEFWQGRRDRLHDRLRYRREDAGGDEWVVERLAP